MNREYELLGLIPTNAFITFQWKDILGDSRLNSKYTGLYPFNVRDTRGRVGDYFFKIM